VRVQVATAPMKIDKIIVKQIDKAAIRPLAGLARTLPAGPLKTALARFLRRAG